MPSWMPGGGWTTLIDGEKGLENFDRVGDANWRAKAIYKAEGKWNTFDITVKGDTITVLFNGQKSVELQNSKFAQGRFSLHFGNHGQIPGGVIKWRKVQVKEL